MTDFTDDELLAAAEWADKSLEDVTAEDVRGMREDAEADLADRNLDLWYVGKL